MMSRGRAGRGVLVGLAVLVLVWLGLVAATFRWAWPAVDAAGDSGDVRAWAREVGLLGLSCVLPVALVVGVLLAALLRLPRPGLLTVAGSVLGVAAVGFGCSLGAVPTVPGWLIVVAQPIAIGFGTVVFATVAAAPWWAGGPTWRLGRTWRSLIPDDESGEQELGKQGR